MRHVLAIGMVMLLASASEAANHYVRSGASGTGSGADWTNAYTDLPATLTRGDTYYISGGTYAAYTFDDSVSGATLITIKKATASDHGTETGWSATYGTTAAAWGAITFATSYWVFDGAAGGGPNSWTSGFGFTFTAANNVDGSFVTFNDAVGNITVRHASFVGTGSTVVDAFLNAFKNASTVNTLLLEYLYIDNLSGLPFFFRGGTGHIIQYAYTGDVCGRSDYNPAQHCEALVQHDLNDSDFRWNYISEGPSSGGYVKNDVDSSDSIRIYGNIFRHAFPIQCNTGTCTNWRIFNNTFVTAIRGGPLGGDGSKTNFLFYNNLTYDTTDRLTPLAGTHGYNWFSLAPDVSCTMNGDSTENICAGCAGGCDSVTETLNPFANISGTTPEDLRLSAAISGWPGTNTCAIETCTGTKQYNLDMFGTTRGADSVWDRGAIEYGSGGGSKPNAPTNVRVR